MFKTKTYYCGRCDAPTDKSLLILIKGVYTCPTCSESIDILDELNSSEFDPSDDVSADMINFGVF